MKKIETVECKITVGSVWKEKANVARPRQVRVQQVEYVSRRRWMRGLGDVEDKVPVAICEPYGEHSAGARATTRIRQDTLFAHWTLIPTEDPKE